MEPRSVAARVEPVEILNSRRARDELVKLAERHDRLVRLVARSLGEGGGEKPTRHVARAVRRVPEARALVYRFASSPEAIDEIAYTLLKLLHLSYLATGVKQVRYAATTLYAVVLASKLDSQRLRGAIPHLLEALSRLLAGDYEGAIGSAAAAVADVLPVKPRGWSRSAWGAALELSYLLEVASEVDGALLEAWGYCRAMED